jgi:hypothetical protein
MDVGESASTKKFRRGVIVYTSAELIYQLTGANMSSPQTAKMNAPARAAGIGEWVNLTMMESVGWTAFLWWLYGSPWVIVGGGLAGTGMWAKYKYAIASGLREGGAPTENYQNPNAPYVKPAGDPRGHSNAPMRTR